MLLIVVFVLVVWATLREDRRDTDRKWIFGLDLGVAALGLLGLVLDRFAGSAQKLGRLGWVVVLLLGIGMAVSFACNVRRGLERPLATSDGEREGFWLLLAGAALVLVVDLAVLWVSVRLAAAGARP